MTEISRWHDKSKKLEELIKILSRLPEEEIDKLAKYLYQVVNIHWKQKKAEEDNLSIGRNKLFGYYKAYQKRRWYDQNPSLRSALNILSTIPAKDADEIIEGFIDALRESGLYDKYYKEDQQAKKD